MSGRRNQERWLIKRQEYQALLNQHGGSISEMAKALNYSRQAAYSIVRNYELEKGPPLIKSSTQLHQLTNLIFIENKYYTEAALELGITERRVAYLINTIPPAVRKTMLKSLNNIYCSNVRTLRMLRGITQEELADKVGIYQGRLSAIERGAGASNKTLAKIAEVLGVTLQIILKPLPYEILCAPNRSNGIR